MLIFHYESCDRFNFLLLPGNEIWKCIGIPCLTEVKHSHPWQSAEFLRDNFLPFADWQIQFVLTQTCETNPSFSRCIYFLFPVWIHLLGTVFSKLWLLDCTVNTILWELSLLCSWRCLTAGAQHRPVQHMEHITWEATCWNRRVHAIFYIRTAKKVEGWAVWDISKARGCWNIDGSTQSFTSMLLKYTISIKSDRLEAKANNFVS